MHSALVASAGHDLTTIAANVISANEAPVLRGATMTQNESVLMRLCMEANGFTSNFEDSSKGFCKGWHSPPPACQPGTPAPARDVNMRLSSAFCHAYPKARVCIP